MSRYLSASLLLLWAASADAGLQPGSACWDDAQQLCSDKRTLPEKLDCLEAQKQRLAPACRENLARMRSAGEEFARDCGGDKARLCPGKDGPELMACLKDSPELSPACSARIEKFRSHRVVKERIAAPCKDDAERLCRAPGAGGVAGCLDKNEAALSPACRQARAEKKER